MTTMLFLHMSGIFLTSFMKLQASRMASRERGEDEVVRVEELPGLCYSGLLIFPILYFPLVLRALFFSGMAKGYEDILMGYGARSRAQSTDKSSSMCR